MHFFSSWLIARLICAEKLVIVPLQKMILMPQNTFFTDLQNPFFFHRDTVFLQMVKSFSTENDPYVLKLIFDLPTKYIFFIMTRLCDSLRDKVKEWSNVLLQKMIPISWKHIFHIPTCLRNSAQLTDKKWSKLHDHKRFLCSQTNFWRVIFKFLSFFTSICMRDLLVQSLKKNQIFHSK